ncbi:YkgJ family cysteine cluster protein [Desulfogranum mediterraneum]|uniref:YkgJ family cysteine cluster protein n=1 Tax=Desulfogranum mediterraneum TaxID=160661 RepID=UPI000686A484|nr:YkgJ family cysteine cluster protein [Desulfogranum mediterraneum]
MSAPFPLLEDTATWIKYRRKLCLSCTAACCSLPVEVTMEDLVRMELIDTFDLEESAKRVAKRLKKAGVIEHFYQKKGLFTLTRLANGDCLYLDQTSRRCTIYEKRPDTCRNHPLVGPRNGFCAFVAKESAPVSG